VKSINDSASEFKINSQAWQNLMPYLYVPHNQKDYEQLVSFLDWLIDQVGEDERHPLAFLMEVVGVLIECYEDEHVPELGSKKAY
jgi:HTH-type transcriptional regulator/antitoxin HigA